VSDGSIKTLGPGWRRALAVCCAGILLFAACTQAAHFCALPGSGGEHSFSNVDAVSAPVPCLLCLSLHAPSLAAPKVFLLPIRDSSPALVVRQPVFRNDMRSFASYVRPPPAA
jgi:hypothetical protein